MNDTNNLNYYKSNRKVVSYPNFSYIKPMESQSEVIYLMVTVTIVAAALGLLAYMTKDSRNFRSSRNRKARKQHQ